MFSAFQAAAITEAKLKMSDIACGVHVCCLFYQRYGEFSNYLMDNWQKYLLSKKDEKVTLRGSTTTYNYKE